MGCNICICVEVLKHNEWLEVPPTNRAPQDDSDRQHNTWNWDGWRNYNTFSHLAGIRCCIGGDPIVEPRGLPLDVSMSVLARAKFETKVNLCHTHSYLMLRELIKHDWKFEEDEDYNSKWFCENFIPTLHVLGEPDQVRMVFWFND